MPDQITPQLLTRVGIDGGLIVAVATALFFFGESYADQENMKKKLQELQKEIQVVQQVRIQQAVMAEQLKFIYDNARKQNDKKD